MKRRPRLTPSRLRQQLGAAAADRLMREWGGHVLPHVSPAAAARAERDSQIRSEIDSGGTYRDVADRYGVSPRRVLAIVNT